MTDAELRGLLADCLTLWSVAGHLSIDAAGLRIMTDEGAFVLQRAPETMRPVRWLLRTPARDAAGRPPRVAPSIVAALSALHNSLGGEGGGALRLGPAA